MRIQLSPQSIEALAFIISGGSANDATPLIGIYRSGPQLERFMRGCNVEFTVGGRSRYPALVDCLQNVTKDPEAGALLQRIIESAADPRDFVSDPERLTAVADYLNRSLSFDGLELQHQGGKVRLTVAGHGTPVVAHLSAKSETFDLDTVRLDLERALASVNVDPEDSVTAACSIVESMCRSILLELGRQLPGKKDISSLYRAVREPLGLSPDRADMPTEIAEDVRKVLGALSSAIEGIGALRTHGGDAHGREKGFRRIDARIARLAIHSASTVALFLLDTWQQKFPTKPLIRHNG
jgi:hypothetical protein